MAVPRLLCSALGALTLLITAHTPAAPQPCVPWIVCPDDNQYLVRRDPYSSTTWVQFPIPSPPTNARIYLTNADVTDHIRKAMRTYSNLDYAVPWDDVSNNGDANFQWGWVAQTNIAAAENRRTGIAAAGTGLNYTNCLITTSIVKFAWDPNDVARQMCWTGDWCDPPSCTTTLCGDSTNIDYLSAAVHEYGHALGLDHSSTGGSTMYSAMLTQDSTGRKPLACELNIVVSFYHDDNPAATVTGYAVARNGGGVTVSWLAEQEASTDHYVIERASDWSGPFTALTTVAVNGSGSYEVAVPAATPGIFRLLEVQSDGNVLPLWTEPDRDPGAAPQFVQQAINFDSTLAALFEGRTPQAPAAGPTQFYIYCPDSLRLTFQTLADAHANWDGVPTEVVTYESIGGPVGVKGHNASHLPSGGYILKVGDAWDGYDVFGQPWHVNPALYLNNGFTMPTWPDQPGLNICPLTYLREFAHQTVSRNYWTPFGATPWYDVDHDTDGLPDPGYYLGYAPVSNRTEAEVFVAKSIAVILRMPNPPANMMPPAAFMTYGVDFGSNSGARALTMASNLTAAARDANPNLFITGVTCSNANPCGVAEANAAMKSKFDSGMSSTSYVSTVSQRYELGAFAHVDIPGYYFDVNALAANDVLSFGVGVTCEMGFSRTENPTFGTPVTERLLFVPYRGFWGYFGPDRGSFQGGNERLGRIFLQHQYSTPSGAVPLTVGELANETVRTAAAFKPDSLLAISYLLVGDPRGRVQSPGPEVVAADQPASVSRPLTMKPNPSRRGEVQFSFALAEPEKVDLSIYDITGRRVAAVVRSALPAGPQLLRWQGLDDGGREVRSGLYLVRLQVGDRVWKHRLALLR